MTLMIFFLYRKLPAPKQATSCQYNLIVWASTSQRKSWMVACNNYMIRTMIFTIVSAHVSWRCCNDSRCLSYEYHSMTFCDKDDTFFRRYEQWEVSDDDCAASLWTCFISALWWMMKTLHASAVWYVCTALFIFHSFPHYLLHYNLLYSRALIQLETSVIMMESTANLSLGKSILSIRCYYTDVQCIKSIMSKQSKCLYLLAHFLLFTDAHIHAAFSWLLHKCTWFFFSFLWWMM